MAISQNMDFPKSSYASKVQVSKVDESPTFFAVPGPQGPQGLPGPKGERGPAGQSGESVKGDKGERGASGKDGKDGKSYFPKYEQNAGWAVYVNDGYRVVATGATRGDDGWVSLYLPSNTSIEDFLPDGAVSLYSQEINKINTRGLKVGAQLRITYNIEVTTSNSNTEVWMKSQFLKLDESITTYCATLKYQHTYEISTTHNLAIFTEKHRVAGIVPQIRTDLDSTVKLKSIYISVY